MSIDSMVAKIEGEIETLKQRIAKLEEAKETILSLEGPLASGGFHNFPTDSEIRSGKGEAEARTPAAPTSPPKKAAGRSFMAPLVDKTKKQPVKEKIRNVLRASRTPMTSSEIIDKIGDGVRRQTIWAALSDMTKKGELTKDPSGHYSPI